MFELPWLKTATGLHNQLVPANVFIAVGFQEIRGRPSGGLRARVGFLLWVTTVIKSVKEILNTVIYTVRRKNAARKKRMIGFFIFINFSVGFLSD